MIYTAGYDCGTDGRRDGIDGGRLGVQVTRPIRCVECEDGSDRIEHYRTDGRFK